MHQVLMTLLQVWGGAMWVLPECGTGAISQYPRSGAASARVAPPLSASCCALALWIGRRRFLSMASAWASTVEGESPLCASAPIIPRCLHTLLSPCEPAHSAWR